MPFDAPSLPPFDPWRSAAVAADVALATRASASQLADRQANRLAALLRAACAQVPLYQRLYKPLLAGGRDPASLRLDTLPVLHKAELMRHFGNAVSDPAVQLGELQRFVADRSRIAEPYLGRYVVWESSGSSGEPCIYLQDAAAMAVYDALEAVRRPWQRALNPWAWNERLVFVGAIGGHFASTVSVERLRRLNPMLASRLCSVSFLQPMPALVAELNALAPAVLATYPSAAVLLAEEQMAGRLKLGLREIGTGGETLSAAMRRVVEQAFSCPVSNSYGASEFLAIAAECHHGALHLNSDWVILEPVDAEGRPVPPGVAGHTTLLTNLANHLQPLIRFDLGDRVSVHAEPCACGSALPVIEVQGRSDDILRLGPAGRHRVQVSPLALCTVLEDEAGLFEFQLVQQGPCELSLSTNLGGEAGRALLRHGSQVLRSFLAGQGMAPVSIHCHPGQAARPGRSGKRQRIVGWR